MITLATAALFVGVLGLGFAVIGVVGQMLTIRDRNRLERRAPRL